MKKAFVYLLLTMALTSLTTRAGTLDDAPFTVTIPDKTWALDDTTAKQFTQSVSLVAVLANADGSLKSVVMKTALVDASPASVSDFFSGAKETLTQSPTVKNFSQKNDTFAGMNVRRFTYEITQNNQSFQNETVIFVSGKIGWTIACVGPTTQKDAVAKILSFYHKKTP